MIAACCSDETPPTLWAERQSMALSNCVGAVRERRNTCALDVHARRQSAVVVRRRPKGRDACKAPSGRSCRTVRSRRAGRLESRRAARMKRRRRAAAMIWYGDTFRARGRARRARARDQPSKWLASAIEIQEEVFPQQTLFSPAGQTPRTQGTERIASLCEIDFDMLRREVLT